MHGCSFAAPIAMPIPCIRLPTCVAAFLLALSCGPATASADDAGRAAAFQRDLVALLECRASPSTVEAVGQALRGAMYGDRQQRPVHLRHWRFERDGDEDLPQTRIEMPAAVRAHGIASARIVADGMGLWMPLDDAQRARIVAEHGLSLRSSNLREPFRVWLKAGVAEDAQAPAAVVVRSDGEGYLLGCDYPGPLRDQRVPARLQDAANAEDFAAALTCRADDAAMQRIANTWERVVERSALAWPGTIRAVAEREYIVGNEALPTQTIALDAPLELYGFPVEVIALAFGGYIAADMGPAPLQQVLAATAMGQAERKSAGYWVREVARDKHAGGISTRELSVLGTDSGGALLGCMSTYLRTATPALSP